MTERDLLVDCLQRLNRAAIEYMLTGSMASNYWGIPRTTHDLDFVIQLPPSMIPELVREFSSDFYLDATAIQSAYRPPHQFNAIDTRSALKVDFWLLRPVPFEREMFARRLNVTLFGQPARISTAEDTILHKLYWNKITPSERQVGDAAGVVAIQKADLNLAYLRKWAIELEVSDLLEDMLAGKVRPKHT